MASSDSACVQARSNLPNLLLATTYAINKSNSKRVIVGLEYNGGLYKPVVKLCSSGSPMKYVTLDPHSWELVLDQMDVMTAFFHNSYAFYGTFGNPSRVYMPKLDVIYKTSYGSKSICFEERPGGLSHRVEPSQPNGNSTDNLPTSSSSSSQTSAINSVNGDVASNSGNDMQPPLKKKRYDIPPSITIQEPTFIGLRDIRECIVTRMDYLNKICVTVNRMIDQVILYLHQKLSSEDSEKVKNIFKDITTFKQFFMNHYVEIHASARKGIDSSYSIQDQTINILLLELTAYGLPWVSKHVYELSQNS